MKIALLYDGKYKYKFVLFIIIISCIVVAVPSYFDMNIFELFASKSNPNYFWQYFSGTFTHMRSLTNNSFLFIHLGLNFLMIIPLGLIIEKNAGNKVMVELLMGSWLICSILFQLLTKGQNQTSAGASAIGYAFGPCGFYYIFKVIKDNSKNIFKQGLFYFYLFIFITMLFYLCPLITGWGSFYLHISGVIVGMLILFLNKKEIDANYDELPVTDDKKIGLSKQYNWLAIIPVFFLAIIIMYYCGILN